MKRFSEHENEKWHHHSDYDALGSYVLEKIQYISNTRALTQADKQIKRKRDCEEVW